MEPVVDLGPGADRNELARLLVDQIRDNVAGGAQRREFERLRGSVGVVVDDMGSALTLRFDFGRLIVHDGLVGVPDVTIRGRADEIRALGDLRLDERLHLPLGDPASRRRLLRLVLGRELKIYGLLVHGRLVLSLLRILSRDGREKSESARGL